MKKRVLSILLLAALCLSLAVPAAAAKTMRFKDVTPNDWFYSSVKGLYEAGVINGTSDTTFSPKGTVTVGEALKMLLLAAGYEEQAPITTHWASGYYRIASAQGFLLDGMTDLNRVITRQQIAQLAVNILGLTRTGTVRPFSDTTDSAALILYDHGIFTGSFENSKRLFKPKDGITRAEISAVILRIYGLVERTGFRPVPPADLPAKPKGSGESFTFLNKKVYINNNLPKNIYDDTLFTINENGFLVYDDENYTCRVGIDVSRYQYSIDWAKVKEAGVEFAILRLGYRGYGSGKMILDDYFYQNLRGAQANGIEVGVYFFSQAITPEEAAAEAQFCLNALSGYHITYPIVYDWEPYAKGSGARSENLDDRVLTQCAIAFCETVENAGYQSMIYSNLNYFYLHLDLEKIKDYPLWLAQYTERPSFYYHFDMWQYGAESIVPGIKGAVDLNIHFIPKH